MTSQRAFTNKQWATAIAAALSLHVLLAWSLIAHEPPFQGAPSADGSGLTVETLSLSGGDLPLLTDVAADGSEPVAVEPVTPELSISQPVASPQVRPVTETPPVEPKPKRKPRQKPPKATQTRSANVDDNNNRSSKGGPPGTSAGSKDTRVAGAGTGVDRAAAPQAGNPRPRYPLVARKRGHEGKVLIRISVLGNGQVGTATVARSSGHSTLDRAALAAVKRWRFKPALRAGKPVAATVTVPVVFRLEG